MMSRRATTAVFAVASMGLGHAMYASPMTAVRVPVHAMFAHEKVVHFAVRNETAVPMKLKCGEDVVSVDPGKTAQVKLPLGTRVTFAETSGAHAAGELLAEAGGQLNGTTIAVR